MISFSMTTWRHLLCLESNSLSILSLHMQKSTVEYQRRALSSVRLQFTHLHIQASPDPLCKENCMYNVYIQTFPRYTHYPLSNILYSFLYTAFIILGTTCNRDGGISHIYWLATLTSMLTSMFSGNTLYSVSKHTVGGL